MTMRLFYLIILLLSLSVYGQNTDKKQTSIDDCFFDAMNERMKENYQKSNEFFEKCLLIDPDNDAVLFKMSQNYFQLKNYEQSLVYLEKAQSIDPKNKWYQKLYIEIKISQNPHDNANYKLIKDFEPVAKNKYIIQDLYRQLSRKKFSSKPQVKFNTKKPKKKTSDLNLLWQQKQYQKLLKEAEKLLETNPDNAKAYLYMAKAYSALKQYDNALDYLEMGLDFATGNKALLKDFYKELISVFQAKGNSKKVAFYKKKLQKL